MARKSKRQIDAEIREYEAAIEALKAERRERWPSRERERGVLDSLSKEESKTQGLKKKTLERDARALPDGWARAAAAERERAGLVEIDLQAEFDKLVIYNAANGRGYPTLGRWLLWARAAYLDHTNRPAPKPEPVDEAGAESGTVALPEIGTEKEQARAAAWARTGLWAPRGQDWGKPPDQAGCTLPAALAAAARARRSIQREGRR